MSLNKKPAVVAAGFLFFVKALIHPASKYLNTCCR